MITPVLTVRVLIQSRYDYSFRMQLRRCALVDGNLPRAYSTSKFALNRQVEQVREETDIDVKTYRDETAARQKSNRQLI